MTDKFFSHFQSFLPFYPSNNPKTQNFEKMKKMPGNIIILHILKIMNICYPVPEMVHGRCNYYFSFWTIFALLPP